MDKTTTPMAPGLDRLPPIFASCVRSDHKRCARPFAIEGHVYATNGHLVARVPTPGGWDIPNPGEIIEFAPRIFRGPFEPSPAPLPEIEVLPCKACLGAKVLPERQCGRCKGTGRVSVWCDCPECDGDHECEACEGTKVIPAGDCGDCERAGVAGDRHERVEVAPGVFLARHYAALLVQQGAAVYLPTREDPELYGLSGKVIPPLRFVIGDVEGRIMPMHPPGSED